ncbi:expressed unknown protein [Seminavis robusta]|uniref:Uncharacterized protein n=1 Tax=Seminavis robusta TaxID=568900 RepID=A0A9N8E810_9STRA|nr:expressed unknown protein [Seminavis robusta]|eukprot:Sro720_g192580.1 n/a (128) ;mRNA; f:20440-20823
MAHVIKNTNSRGELEIVTTGVPPGASAGGLWGYRKYQRRGGRSNINPITYQRLYKAPEMDDSEQRTHITTTHTCLLVGQIPPALAKHWADSNHTRNGTSNMGLRLPNRDPGVCLQCLLDLPHPDGNP